MLVKNPAVSTVGALNATAAVTVEDADSFAVAITGTFSGTITFEATADNTNWFSMAIIKSDSADRKAGTATTTSTGLWLSRKLWTPAGTCPNVRLYVRNSNGQIL